MPVRSVKVINHPMSKEYKTAAEYRAFVEGAYSIIDKVMDMAAQQWKLGRTSLDLDCLRDALIDSQCEAATCVTAAQELEAPEPEEPDTCTCHGARDSGLAECPKHSEYHPYWDSVLNRPRT